MTEEKTGPTILIAEDNPAVRGFISAVLSQAGYQVLVAEDGGKSLEICTNHAGQIAALVTDVMMPNTNGRELAERARLVRPHLNVLFVSGYADRAPKEVNQANPCFAFLEKPFTAESLLTAVGNFCPLAAVVCS